MLEKKFCLIRKFIANLFLVVKKYEKNLILSTKSYDKNISVYWTIESWSL
jgi:hypothetical protein